MTLPFDPSTLESDDLRKPVPLFYVQAPDGRKDWPEDKRQTVMFREMRSRAPTVDGFHIPNAGPRNPMKSLAAGIKAGPFDTEWAWPLCDDDGHNIAWVEIKGYTKAGRAGALSIPQIEWGNRRHMMGFAVACFFDPYDAVEWLRGLGAPIAACIK